MHNAALDAVGLPGWRYQLLPIAPELIAETLVALPAAGFRGVNVTIPHKAAALAVAGHPSPRARAIGAANTLVFEADGRILADNTDAPALVAALSGRPPRTALVLGAGGTARAAVWALRDTGIEDVAVWNRTPERARELAADLGARPVEIPEGADVLVNCTSVGLAGEDPFQSLPLAPPDLADYATVVDYVYARRPSGLLGAARAAGARTVDGLELLVGQGALSFTAFTGLPAPRDVMRAAVRA